MDTPSSDIAGALDGGSGGDSVILCQSGCGEGKGGVDTPSAGKADGLTGEAFRDSVI